MIRRDFEEEFKQTVGAKYESVVEVAYAYQSLDDLPAGYTVPDGREKPWGTAHALRSARAMIDGAFAAINADDFYGSDSFSQLAEFLKSADPNSARFALVGFRMDHTLSENGSVARGVCTVDESGKLTTVTEKTKLVPVAGGAQDISDPDNVVSYTGAERVSMNLWGFTPLFRTRLRERSYNQALVLASALAVLIDRRIDSRSFKRIRSTATQTQFNSAQRKKNMAGAFKVVRPEWIRERTILLVDDVMTTGATLNECARELKRAGSHRVFAISAARR